MKEPERAFSGQIGPESLLFDQAKFMGISEKLIRSQGKTTMEGAVKAFFEIWLFWVSCGSN